MMRMILMFAGKKTKQATKNSSLKALLLKLSSVSGTACDQ